jgi:hypothetical protein
LLAAADPCAQQDSADDFIDFAKLQPSSANQDMIALSQIFAQQPRNSVSLSPLTQCISSYIKQLFFFTAQQTIYALLSNSS